MRVPIKMIIEDAKKGDQVEYSGVIEKVFEFKDKPTKWSIGNQTIVVADDSGKINTVLNIRTDRNIYGPEYEGKEVVVSGIANEWEGKKNVFGKKISFTENWQKEDRPKTTNNNSDNNQSQQVFATHNITPEQIRIECLKITLKHSEILKDTKSDTQDLINNAKIYEKYVTGGNKIKEATNTIEEVLDKAKKLFDSKMEEEVDEDLPEKVKKINYIMELAEENQSIEAVDDFIEKCGQGDIKELTLQQLETLVRKLEMTPPDESKIPF